MMGVPNGRRQLSFPPPAFLSLSLVGIFKVFENLDLRR